MAFPAGISSRAPLLLVGCGHMGGALLKAWLETGLPVRHVVVADPKPRGLPRKKGLRVFKDAADALAKAPRPRVAVIAVKPQSLGMLFKELGGLQAGKTLILSIAAGARIRTFERAFGKGARVVRAMPNTAAAVGRGVTVFVANRKATAADRRLARALLAAAGKVHETGAERRLDAVTAVSGSGPAYFFLMVEALAEAGRKAGLRGALAERLAVETFLGSAALLEAAPGRPAAHRKRVTSKGGTTEAALSVLMGRGGLKPLLKKAVAKAAARGRQLAR